MKHFLKKQSSANTLVIVESPSKCAKIEEYLGHEFQCVATCGHIREIANGLDGINAPNFDPTFSVVKDKKGTVAQIKALAKEFAHILVATDDDREGEAIGWHICQVLRLPVETTPRIVFHEITRHALQHAVQHPRVLDLNLVKAQQARQVLDLMVGYRISPHLWRALAHCKSAGRCQTPTLRLVYDNHRLERKLDILYRTTATFQNGLTMTLNREFSTPEQVESFLHATKTHLHEMSVAAKREKIVPPPLPLTTSRLLQLASHVLHMSPKDTMRGCQKLYQDGLITYMRTDSTMYSSTFRRTAATYIAAHYPQILLATNAAAAAAAAAAAHEAIRVTDINSTDNGSALYRFIWKITVQSCMPAAHYDVFPVHVTAPQELLYTYNVEIPTSLGWHCLEHGGDSNTVLPTTIDRAWPTTVMSTAVARNTHAHYTEANLVKTLEAMGIGRPSTYASLVETIQERGYVRKQDVAGETHHVRDFLLQSDGTLCDTFIDTTFGNEQNKLVIQPSGIACVEFLMQFFAPLFAYEYTQDMERRLDEIAHGATEPKELCQQCSDEMDRLSSASSSSSSSSSCLVYPLVDSSDNVLVISPQQGVRLRRTDPIDQTVTHVPVTGTVDMDRARLGKCTTTEMLRRGGDGINRSGILRRVNTDCSIREGKFGPYIFYKTSDMKVPQFTPLGKLAWKTATESAIMKRVRLTHP